MFDVFSGCFTRLSMLEMGVLSSMQRVVAFICRLIRADRPPNERCSRIRHSLRKIVHESLSVASFSCNCLDGDLVIDLSGM